jgi:hypothetical protein
MSSLPHEGERVVFVELCADGSPYQVFTRAAGGCGHAYDIEFSRAAHGYLMERSGGGRPCLQEAGGRWWAPADFDPARVRVFDDAGKVLKGGRPTPAARAPADHLVPVPGGKAFRIDDLADQVEVVDRLLYCPTCVDWFEAPDRGAPCEHVTYCNKCGTWDGHDGQRCRHGDPPPRPDQPSLFDPEEE